MLLGVEAAARERGAQVLFRHIESNLTLQSQALEEARAYGAAGVLLFPVDATYRDPALLHLLAEGFPVVLLDHYIPGVDVDYVVPDGYGGMLRAVQHLLGFGHRRIGFVTWDVQRSGEAGRFIGYQQGLREWGIEPSVDLICQLEEYPVEDLSPLTELLSRPNRPTAIVALNDYLAIKVMKVCRDLKLRIPQDLALIGFDNTDLAAQLEVPLTTVSQPIHEIGAQAVRFLLNKIGGFNQGPQRLILPTSLIIRESSGNTLTAAEVR
jgi:DNA-binding LacI/PurR family transcriptional regulator